MDVWFEGRGQHAKATRPFGGCTVAGDGSARATVLGLLCLLCWSGGPRAGHRPSEGALNVRDREKKNPSLLIIAPCLLL